MNEWTSRFESAEEKRGTTYKRISPDKVKLMSHWSSYFTSFASSTSSLPFFSFTSQFLLFVFCAVLTTDGFRERTDIYFPVSLLRPFASLISLTTFGFLFMVTKEDVLVCWRVAPAVFFCDIQIGFFTFVSYILYFIRVLVEAWVGFCD